MSKVLIISIFIFSFVSCNVFRKIATQLSEYTINGHIIGQNEGKVYLQIYDTAERGPLLTIDSTMTRQLFFHFKGNASLPMMGKIYFYSGESYELTRYFVLDTGTLIVELYKDSILNSIIKGGKLNNQLDTFNQRIRQLKINFQKPYLVLKKQGVLSDDSLKTLKSNHERDIYLMVFNEIRNNRHSLVSSFLADRENILELADYPDLKVIYETLGDADNYFARKFRREYEIMVKTDVGKELPSFKLRDSKNKIYTERSFKGNYLLLNFWASWCIWCRDENPALVKLYDKYKDKNIKMVSISIDSKRDEWLKAVVKDGMVWIQALADDEGRMASRFDVRYIPLNYLVDPQGKIIGKDLDMQELESKLESIFTP